MVDENIKNKIISILTCASENNKNEHICEEPIVLSCGHHICKKCIKSDVDYEKIVCKACKKQNERNLSAKHDPITFKFIFNDYFTELCQIVFEDLKINFEKFKEILCEKNDSIELHFEYAREQIDIRIESLKNQLDCLHESLNKQLEETKENIKSKLVVCKNNEIFNEKSFENELDKFENCICNKMRITNEEFYEYQKKLENLKDMIEKVGNKTMNIYFQDEDFELKDDHIGRISCFKSDVECNQRIFDRIKDGNFTQIDLNDQSIEPFDMCVLPKGNLLIAHRGISIYDKKMNLMKRMDSLHGLKNILCVTLNEQDEIYFCDYSDKNCVLKTDLQLNKLAEIEIPASGVCFYNGCIYVCNGDERTIEKYDSNLNYQSTITLDDFTPQYMKNVKNIACIRSYGSGILFYDLDTMTETRRYKSQIGLIGVVGNTFYQYSVANRKFSCYSSSGELLNEIITNGYGLDYSNQWGTICYFNSKLCFCQCGTSSLLSI